MGAGQDARSEVLPARHGGVARLGANDPRQRGVGADERVERAVDEHEDDEDRDEGVAGRGAAYKRASSPKI